MKIYSPSISCDENRSSFEVAVGLNSKINFLIIAHLLVFVLYVIGGLEMLPYHPWGSGSLDDFVKHYLAVSFRAEDFRSHWLTSMFTYQFVHFSISELLLSISMLWLFGHILQNKLSQLKVIFLYFAFSIFSVIIFYLSHLIFPIFSEPKGIMNGAFGGVLGIMSVTVFLYGNHRLHLNNNVSVELWKIYMIALLLSLIFVYKHNMAYILVNVCTIYAGKLCADAIQKEEETASI